MNITEQSKKTTEFESIHLAHLNAKSRYFEKDLLLSPLSFP